MIYILTLCMLGNCQSAAVTIGALRVNAFFIVVCGDKVILLLFKYCKNLQVC